MATATVLAYQDTGATGATNTNVDSGASGTAPIFGTDDNVQSTTPVAIPQTSPNTVYSANKNFYLRITVAATTTTTINNRNIKQATASASGFGLFWKANTGAYVQGSVPAGSAANGPAVPSTYTQMTTSNVQYDNTNASSTATGKNGAYVQVVAGIDATVPATDAGSNIQPVIDLTYDEF